MILLLDANALLWWLEAHSQLRPEANSAIKDPGNDVLVSAATVWELAIKRATGRIRPPEDVSVAIDQAGFTALPITTIDAERAGALPLHHRDPFDRMLVAQALRLDATVVSRDAVFDRYLVPRLEA